VLIAARSRVRLGSGEHLPAVALSFIAFGLGAPISGGLVDRFGPTRIMLGGSRSSLPAWSRLSG
jgi:MFS family permease